MKCPRCGNSERIECVGLADVFHAACFSCPCGMRFEDDSEEARKESERLGGLSRSNAESYVKTARKEESS